MFAKIFGKKSYPFGLPGLDFPIGSELEHTLIPATTGSGKSQAIHCLLDRILEGIDMSPEREKALITDPGGQFMSTRAHSKNDRILNPFDHRSKRWNPFCEVESDYDYKLLATAVIPDVEGRGQETEWRNYARTMLVSLMKGLHRSGKSDPREVQRLLSTADPEALAPFLVGSPSESLLSGPNERFLAGVIGVLANALAPWEFLSPDGDFSIREWVRSGTGVLFLTYTDAQIEAMRPLLGCWLSLAIRETLSLPIELDQKGMARRRMWFVMDELDSLGTVHGLTDALSRGRKPGLAVISAIQSIAQLRIRYGKDGAQALMSCFVNKLVMRQGDFEDAKHWSDYLGQFEEERLVRTHSISSSGETTGTQSHREIRPLVLPAELQDLPKFCGYARISGLPGIRSFKFQPQNWPTKFPAFVRKEA
ncbi:MAG: type IV secretion system DNA-binding domain-containing protein [Leptospirales bacterium]